MLDGHVDEQERAQMTEAPANNSSVLPLTVAA